MDAPSFDAEPEPDNDAIVDPAEKDSDEQDAEFDAELGNLTKNAFGPQDDEPEVSQDDADDALADEPAPEPEEELPTDDNDSGAEAETDDEEKDEAWDNSPDEKEFDIDTMVNRLSGGLNDKGSKTYPKVSQGDNPMQQVESIKEQLWAALNEKKGITNEGLFDDYDMTTSIRIDDEDPEVGVEFEVGGSYRAATRYDPEEFPEIEIIKVTDLETGQDYTDYVHNNSQVFDELHKEIEEKLNDDGHDDEDNRRPGRGYQRFEDDEQLDSIKKLSKLTTEEGNDTAFQSEVNAVLDEFVKYMYNTRHIDQTVDNPENVFQLVKIGNIEGAVDEVLDSNMGGFGTSQHGGEANIDAEAKDLYNELKAVADKYRGNQETMDIKRLSGL